jgi:DNA-binding beta-propeller fold protein YncE
MHGLEVIAAAAFCTTVFTSNGYLRQGRMRVLTNARALVLTLATMAGTLASALGTPPVLAQPAPSLVLEATIPLDGVSGRIDHMAADLKRKRLMVAELGNNSVDVVDLAGRKVTHRITGLHEPQGVGYVEQADLIVVANAGDGTVQFFRASDFTQVASLSLGDDADNIRVDPRNGNVLVGYGEGGLAVIDPVRQVTIADTKLPAHPEGFQVVWEAGRAFVNLPDARQIAVVDVNNKRVANIWKPAQARANFPMALDRDAGLVAVVFRTPPRLVLFDQASGRVSADVPACGDADDVFFDGKRHRLYISCGSGEVTAFQQEGGTIRSMPPVKTSSGARTSLFVPEIDRLFVAQRAGWLGGHAAILVYRPA